MSTPEGDFKAQIIAFFNKTGEWIIRQNPGKLKVKRGYLHGAPEGTADFLIMRNPVGWLELKAPGQKTKKERVAKQTEFRDKVLALGHKHCQAESLEDVQRFLSSW